MKTGQSGHYLAWVDREIEQVLSLEQRWESEDLPVEDRQAARAEWDDVLNRYLAVVAALDAGQRGDDESYRLRVLSARLSRLAPALDRMRLRRPDPAILTRLGPVTAS